MKKYQCWWYSENNGWRINGAINGYDSLEELKRDCELTLKEKPTHIQIIEFQELSKKTSSSSPEKNLDEVEVVSDEITKTSRKT